MGDLAVLARHRSLNNRGTGGSTTRNFRYGMVLEARGLGQHHGGVNLTNRALDQTIDREVVGRRATNAIRSKALKQSTRYAKYADRHQTTYILLMRVWWLSYTKA